MPPNREQIDARHLARVRAGFMDAIGRRDGRAIKDFYDELRRLGLTAEQGPLGVGDVTKLLGEPKGIVPARPSMGESWSAPPQDPRDFKALVQKMTDRAADLEDSRIGPMSPTPSQLPQPREAGPYGGGFSTFPPRGYGYWEKGPGGRGVWVDQKPAKGMKEYQRVMKGLERVLKVGRDPVDPPGTMPPGRRVVTPPVAPELQRNYKLQDLYEKTGQRSFPGWLQLDKQPGALSEKRARDFVKWSKLAFGKGLGRKELVQLYAVLSTTPPNQLRKVLMDPKTPQWMQDTIESWRLHKRGGVPQFPDTLKRAIARLRTLEKAEGVGAPATPMGRGIAGIMPIEGLPEVPPEVPPDPARLARAEKAVTELQRAVDIRKSEGVGGLGHKARAAAEKQIEARMNPELIYAMHQTKVGPGGKFGELPADFDKLRGMARTSMGEAAIGPMTQAKTTQEMLRAAILGGYATTPGGDVMRQRLVAALAQGELTPDMIDTELTKFAQGKDRVRAAKYGLDVPAAGERIFDDEPRADVEKRARRTLARDLTDSQDRKITQLLRAEMQVGEADVRAYGKSRLAMERGEDWLSSKKGVAAVLGDAKWQKLSTRDKRARLVGWSEGFTEERLDRLNRVKNYAARNAPKYRAPLPGETPAHRPAHVPAPPKPLPLWQKLTQDPVVPLTPRVQRLRKAEAIGGPGAKVMIREIERLIGGKTVYRRKRVPQRTAYRPHEISPTRLLQPRVRKPLGPVRAPKEPILSPIQRTFEPLYTEARTKRAEKTPKPHVRAAVAKQLFPTGIPKDPMQAERAEELLRKRLRMFSTHGKGIFGKASPKPPTAGWQKVQQIIKVLARMPK